MTQEPQPEVPGVEVVDAHLARVVLSADARIRLRDALDVLQQRGLDALFERYPDLDDGSGEEPSPVELLTEIGHESETIIWLDWKGEGADWICEQVEEACVKLGLQTPSWGDERHDGTHFAAEELLGKVDAALQRVGQRLLLIDLGTDSYEFVPVTAADYAGLRGASGDDYEIFGVEDLR